MPARRVPLADRFWAKVDMSSGPEACWPWTGATRYFRHWRYGAIQADAPDRKLLVASRVALELQLGRSLRDTEVACHRCDDTLCVNPAHLFIGSDRDNTQDMIRKGRHPYFRLTADQANEIRARYAAGGITQRVLAAEYGVTPPCINKILKGTRQREAA